MARYVQSQEQVMQANTGRKKRNVFWTVVMWAAIAVFVAALGYLGVIMFSYWNDANRYEVIATDNVDIEPETGGLADMTADWDALRAINPEVVGWIYIPDTPVNYPVCWSGDNEKYLNMNFDGNQGVWTGCGTIFLDADDRPDFSNQNVVLYGHHMNDGSMFACLSDFASDEVFEAHRTIYLLTPDRNYQFRSFALIRTNGSEPLVTVSFKGSEDRARYVQDKMNRNMVTPSDGAVDPFAVEKLLTLSTCDYNEYDGRAVLFSNLEDSAVPRNSASTVVGTTEGYAG